jgi:hypothetical protein
VALVRFSMHKERAARRKTKSVTEKHREASCVNEAPITGQASLDLSSSDPLIESYHHELLLHCYHLLGSLSKGEDAAQERCYTPSITLTRSKSGPGCQPLFLMSFQSVSDHIHTAACRQS